MDFNFGRSKENVQPRDMCNNEEKSDDDKPSLSRSFSQGSQKFFGSVIAKKNGLLDGISGISSKFDQVLNQGPGTPPPPMSPPAKPPRPPRPKPPVNSMSIDRSNFSSAEHFSFDQKGENRINKKENQNEVEPLPSNMAINFDTPLYKRQANVDRIEQNAGEARQETEQLRSNQHNTAADVHVDNQNATQSIGHSAPQPATGHKNPFNTTDPEDYSVKNPFAEMQTGAEANVNNQQQIKVKQFMDNIPTFEEPQEEIGDSDHCNQNILHPSIKSDHFFEPIKPELDSESVHQLADPWMSAGLPKSTSDLIKFSPCPSPQPQVDDNSGNESSDTEGCDDVDQLQGSIDSSDVEYGGQQVMARTTSGGSEQSWCSTDSQMDELSTECMDFMKMFVEKIFSRSSENGDGISQRDKAKFGELCQQVPGRLWFARYVNAQRVHNKQVGEDIFYRLVQYFAVVLFECCDAEDYVPAKTIMNMCFTFYYEVTTQQGKGYRHFLYSYLCDQPIWQSLRFWNAAFFDAVQCERARKPVCRRSDGSAEIIDDHLFQENITFGQLGTFTCNMRAFGLSKELCLEFLRKQSVIANLREEQVKMLRDNVEKLRE